MPIKTDLKGIHAIFSGPLHLVLVYVFRGHNLRRIEEVVTQGEEMVADTA